MLRIATPPGDHRSHVRICRRGRETLTTPAYSPIPSLSKSPVGGLWGQGIIYLWGMYTCLSNNLECLFVDKAQ